MVTIDFFRNLVSKAIVLNKTYPDSSVRKELNEILHRMLKEFGTYEYQEKNEKKDREERAKKITEEVEKKLSEMSALITDLTKHRRYI